MEVEYYELEWVQEQIWALEEKVRELEQEIKRLKEDKLYWYNQGWFDAVMEMNKENE